MVERKVYKTKLCVLYQKGHCHRHSCNFAHGDAERRRFSGPFEGRRDYRGRDLREKLNRRYSPPRRYPLRRDISGRHASRGDSPSGSLEKSDRRRRKRQQPDGQSDLSESLQTSNETQDRLKEKKCVSYDSKHTLKIRQLQSEIKKLDDHKKGLEVYLEDRSLEAENLALKVEELEVQMFKEKDECKRIASRIKKFIEAHKHLSRLHDEVKRSDAQLRKLGEKLFSSASASGDDLSMNIVTDGEAVGFPIIYGEMRKNMSPHKKRPRVNPEDVDVPGQDNPSGAYAETISLENNPSRRNVLQIQSSNYKKVKADIIRTNGFQDAEGEDRPVRGEDRSTNTTLVEKPKGIFEVLPSTGMAAHAEDEDVEVVEIEEKHEMYENASVVVAGEAVFGVKNVTSLPPPPPLPIYKDSYSQLKGQDENVDIDGIDEEATEVDIV